MMIFLLTACFEATPAVSLPFEQRLVEHDRLYLAFPSDRVKERKSWASDLEIVLKLDNIPVSNGDVCSVVATIEQESGYQTDPAVPGIGGMVDSWIEEKQASMSKIPGWALATGFKVVLDSKPSPTAASYSERLHAAKTEKDVDMVFRDFIGFYRSKLPEPLKTMEAAAQFVGFDLDDLNPITTAGCMQVKVEESEKHARKHGTEESTVRDSLYGRQGCMHYGGQRLLGWEAGYTDPVYRFADYNAGYFASRNAAFQEQVARLTGRSLALDGDLLRYNDRGSPASEPSQTLAAVLELLLKQPEAMGEARIRRELAREKEQAFEQTEVWQTVRRLYKEKTGKEPAYARLPDVELSSIKLSGKKTTAWFAQNVKKRYDACIGRLGG